MGLLSFLFGKKQARTPAPAARTVASTPASAVSQTSLARRVASPAGYRQAKLRLRFAASVRTGEHAAAYEAAKALADIQIRAGRKNVARLWQEQASKIHDAKLAS